MEYILIDFEGSIAKVEASLEASARAALNPQPAFRIIYEDLLRIEKAIFASQGRRGGGSWRRLKPDTIKRKGSSEILVDTGALKTSLTEPGAPYQILNMGNTEMEFGSELGTAAIHQSGAPSRNIPARPMIRFTQADHARWNDILLQHLTRSLRGD